MTRSSDERGIALVMAVFALVIIGALVTAVFFTAQLEQRTGTNTMSGQQAAEAAQAGIDYAVANWQKSWTSLGAGNSAGIASTQLGSSGGYYTDTVTQLNSVTFVLRSYGTAQNGGGATLATRSMGMIFKKWIANLNIKAAATVSGSVDVNGSSSLSGNDAVPAGGGWAGACLGDSLANQPGLRTDGSTPVSKPGNVSPVVSYGDTSVASTVADVNAQYNLLASAADITLSSAPSVGPVLNASHACAEGQANPGNWGDPTYAAAGTYLLSHPCAGYFPIIHFTGSVGLGNVTGQGILLIDGDLSFNANFDFYGLILVKGQVSHGNGNSQLHGAIVAQNAVLGDASNFNGNTTIAYSSCAVANALAASASAKPFTQRAFVQF
ncbi:MAG: hypothetical protein ACHQXA_01155 [Gemmatimonadales bacterium]